MEIKELKSIDITNTDDKSIKTYNQFVEFIGELRTRDLPENIKNDINISIDKINYSILTEKELIKSIKKEQTLIIKQIEKELKIVPKNHYRNLWLVLGMSAFGLPLGVLFGISLGNIGLLGIGLPIGMVIGMLFGSRLDKKALNEGRQMNIEFKN